MDDSRRRALHAFLDGRLAADVSSFTRRQGQAVRRLEAFVRGAVSKADAAIADAFGPAGTGGVTKSTVVDKKARTVSVTSTTVASKTVTVSY